MVLLDGLRWEEARPSNTLYAGLNLVYELLYRCRYAHRRLARHGSPRSWSPHGADRAALLRSQNGRARMACPCRSERGRCWSDAAFAGAVGVL